MRKVVSVVALILFCAAIGKTWHWAKDGFSLSRISVWETGYNSSLDDEALSALDQPFYYLGRGHQCYAFESRDGRYVIKIPRTDRYHLPFWLRALPLTDYRNKIQSDIGSRERFLLNSFQISFEFLREETALLALHLGKSKDEGRILSIVDRLGRMHRLPMRDVAFALQRKEGILMNRFQEAIASGDRAKARQILFSFADTIIERAKKGILNKDGAFMRNYGYDGSKAYQIDIGSFYRIDGISLREACAHSMEATFCPVRPFLAKIDPELLEALNRKIDAVLEEI